VGVSKPKYHVWLSFMLYFGLLTPTFGFPLCYILVYLLPRSAFLYVIFWFTYSHVWLSFIRKQQKYKHSKTNQSYDLHRKQQKNKHNKTNQSYDQHRIVTLVCFTVSVLLLFFYANRNFGLFYCVCSIVVLLCGS
jgi:L-asparagine transporter-like permease